MIKKLVCGALCISLTCGAFCGCSVRRGLDDGHILTAIGFDYEENEYTVFCELTVIPDRQDEDIKATVYTATGQTPENALYNLSLNFQKAVYFDHCAALLIGNGVEDAELGAVISYCVKERNINTTLYTVHCEDINTLLKTETSAAAVGYHIMNLLQFRTRESGIDYKSRLYEIASEKGEIQPLFTLPELRGGEEITLTGATVFKNKMIAATLNNDEYISYSILTERFKKGRISLYGEFADIKRVKYDFRVKDTEQEIDSALKIRIKTKNKSKGFEGVLKAQMLSLESALNGLGILFVSERADERGIDIKKPKTEKLKFLLEVYER